MNNLKLNKLNKINDELKQAVNGGESEQPKVCGCACCYIQSKELIVLNRDLSVESANNIIEDCKILKNM